MQLVHFYALIGNAFVLELREGGDNYILERMDGT